MCSLTWWSLAKESVERQSMSLFDQLSLLIDREPREQEVQAFLATNPIILQRWVGGPSNRIKVLPQVSFQKYVTDFAIGVWSETIFRWEWTLIEIEQPSHKLFIRSGDPSHQLTHALRQIADWRAWIQNNLHYARAILPDIVPLCPVRVIMGRRRDVLDAHRDLLAMLQLQSPGIRINTYDSLLDVCKSIEEGRT
jgi:hypothetical protein